MLFALLGFGIGAIGTLIGVGGGFLLVPILLMFYPDKSNMWVGSLSMWMIALNATSGSISYHFKRVIHFRIAAVSIVAAFPGSVCGVMLEHYVSRGVFEKVFGVVLLGYASFLLLRKLKVAHGGQIGADSELPRRMYVIAGFISFWVGFVASFLGLGGGVVHVPLLAHVMGFPVHLAAGTSHLILAVTAWFASAVHIYQGDLSLADPMAWQLGIGAAVGAQVGARLSSRVSGPVIMKILAVALLIVALRLLLR